MEAKRPDYQALSGFILPVFEYVNTFALPWTSSSYEKNSRLFKGKDIISILDKLNIRADVVAGLKASLSVVIEDKPNFKGGASAAAEDVPRTIEMEDEAPKAKSGSPSVTDGTVNLVRSLLTTLTLLFDGDNLDAYRFVLIFGLY
jgi:hypothetical protein